MAAYCFATLLADAEGAWQGRLLRWSDGSDDAPPAWLADVPPAAPGELLLPDRPSQAGWQPVGNAGASRIVEASGRRIALDTARDPDWSFSASGVVLADLGWLLNRRPDERRQSPGKRSPLQLIRLLADIERDADTRELEKSFRGDPELSFQLLRLLNSAAFGMRTPVRGLGQAITLLGRRQLQRWLQLLIYAQSGSAPAGPNPLQQLAAYRGLLLESLARQTGLPDDDPDAAYMTGIFSLLDRLVPQSLAEIVRQLPLAPAVAAALARREGRLGEQLALAVAVERGDLPEAAERLERFAITPESWFRLQDAAYAWAYGLGLPGAAPA